MASLAIKYPSFDNNSGRKAPIPGTIKIPLSRNIQVFEITGTPVDDKNQFEIDLVTNDNKICMRLTVKMAEHKAYLSCRDGQGDRDWIQHETRDVARSFGTSRVFKITITMTTASFDVKIRSHAGFKYTNHIGNSFGNVASLCIHGNITLQEIAMK